MTFKEYVQKLRKDIDNEYGSTEKENLESFMTMEQFVKKRFLELSEKLKFMLQTLYTHLPKSFISIATVKITFEALESVRSIGILLYPANFKQSISS